MINKTHDIPGERPALLLMTGDQVYADDVGGPLIRRLSELGRILTGWDETIPGMGRVPSRIPVYGRTNELKNTQSGFTSGSSDNHLMTFGEYAAMYLMAWNEGVWEDVLPDHPEYLSDEQKELYDKEAQKVTAFKEALHKVRRVLANTPTYMIFDDHEVTDDWQISRKWAHDVNNSPCGRRIVSNALAAYWAFQGWGNMPEAFPYDFITAITDHLNSRNSSDTMANVFDFKMWSFHGWGYWARTDPPIIAIDSRTQREFDSFKGTARLLDRYGLDWLRSAWASLGSPKGKDLLILAATPVYGFEPLECLQKISTSFGIPSSKVDNESWIANRKGFSAFMRCLVEKLSPRSCVVLSGDVHYSFTTKAEFKGVKGKFLFRQCTSSALKNEPKVSRKKLLDRLQSFSRPVEHRMGWNPDAKSYVKPLKPILEFLVRFNIIRSASSGWGFWTDTVRMLLPEGDDNPLVLDTNIGVLRIKENGQYVHEIHSMEQDGGIKSRIYNF